MSDFHKGSVRWHAEQYLAANAKGRVKIANEVEERAIERPHKARWQNLNAAIKAGDELRLQAYIGEVEWDEVHARDKKDGRPGEDARSKAKTSKSKAGKAKSGKRSKAKSDGDDDGSGIDVSSLSKEEALALLNEVTKQLKGK